MRHESDGRPILFLDNPGSIRGLKPWRESVEKAALVARAYFNSAHSVGRRQAGRERGRAHYATSTFMFVRVIFVAARAFGAFAK